MWNISIRVMCKTEICAGVMATGLLRSWERIRKAWLYTQFIFASQFETAGGKHWGSSYTVEHGLTLWSRMAQRSQ